MNDDKQHQSSFDHDIASEPEKTNQERELDPFDPARLRLSQNFAATLGVKKHLTILQVRKPNKQDFIRVHPSPDYRLETAILEFKKEGESYLVDPSLWRCGIA